MPEQNAELFEIGVAQVGQDIGIGDGVNGVVSMVKGVGAGSGSAGVKSA